ncbi:leukotriene A4 hydrolase C-terminal domain-containing protein [uncultured Paraglaciecola sp.]|uniref:leukotriene A4 hydrolase C-terminal domain-containing protein n=1 Tax=uncultured Paraglaciecola sp. TaxID=1765024 RepID=UPI0025F6544D|nr:leukotriene A4 hydrolase C-terminal domain-containing protein [uncultured Paraglaciecola sp.]
MFIKYIVVGALAFAMLSGCSDNSSSNTTASAKVDQSKSSADLGKNAIQVGKDYHSFANPESIKVTHLSLDLTVDFSKKVLLGTAQLDFQRVDPKATQLILDTRDLTIEGVTSMGKVINYDLANADSFLGAALTIEIPADANSVVISYQTSPNASGVQWLTPEQTAGKKHPFLFTQAQAIHARSFIPLQDSPQVRMTYEAIIRTPKELLAVMSASNEPDTERDGVYEFSMPQAIPSYLIALAVGDLHFKSMGERTGVYSEKGILNAAAEEFSDTESMLIATEKAFGPYSWDRYDLLILPPSFPFGGMENPRLSFITPTVIAGDKSLVSLIAHELAHSWSGNTVTNATWRDLWLNEGFTTYLTYRIMQMIYGDERFEMEAVLGRQDLQADIDSLPANDQIMAIDLRGRDPDAVFSNIPYEKGALFLRELEHKVGRENFDQFLLGYFEKFAFKSITTDQFVNYLEQTLLKDHSAVLSKQRIEQWIFQPGVPADAPIPESYAFSVVDEARDAWLAGSIQAGEIDSEKWVVHQWLYFLNNMPEKLSQEQLVDLDKAFSLTSSKNNEIAHSWLLISVNNWYQPAFTRLHDYLTSIGRNKLVKPLYKALSQTPEGKVMAQKAFAEAKAGYHPLTVKTNEGFVQ